VRAGLMKILSLQITARTGLQRKCSADSFARLISAKGAIVYIGASLRGDWRLEYLSIRSQSYRATKGKLLLAQEKEIAL